MVLKAVFFKTTTTSRAKTTNVPRTINILFFLFFIPFYLSLLGYPACYSAYPQSIHMRIFKY